MSRQSPIIPLDTGTVVITAAGDTHYLRVELAETAEQKAIGLMERHELPDDEGMLFLYSATQPGSAAFHMYRTHVPLDIVFMDSVGEIVALLHMEPCNRPVAAWCELYAPGVPYGSALEANLGWFEARGIGVGDVVWLSTADSR